TCCARRRLHRTVLAIRERTLPAGDPAIASSLRNLASALASQGVAGEAEAMYRRALDITPSGRPEVASILQDLGYLQLHSGRFTEAEQSLCEAIRILEAHFGSSSSALLPALDNYANLLRKTGRKREGDLKEARAAAIRAATDASAAEYIVDVKS